MATSKREYRCPNCGSRRTTSNGYRDTVTMGLRNRRYCGKCKREYSIQAPVKQPVNRSARR